MVLTHSNLDCSSILGFQWSLHMFILVWCHGSLSQISFFDAVNRQLMIAGWFGSKRIPFLWAFSPKKYPKDPKVVAWSIHHRITLTQTIVQMHSFTWPFERLFAGQRGSPCLSMYSSVAKLAQRLGGCQGHGPNDHADDSQLAHNGVSFPWTPSLKTNEVAVQSQSKNPYSSECGWKHPIGPIDPMSSS